MKKILYFAILAVLALGTTACNKNKKGDQYAGIDGDYAFGTPLPDRVEGSNFFSGNVDRTRFQNQVVYFGFDRFDVSDGEIPKVSDIANAMKSMKNDIIIAGFTDERGTEEYNRGLGERRAQAVREALIGMGVNPARIQTVSFGKEMPADPGTGEAAWAKNRRAEFGVIK